MVKILTNLFNKRKREIERLNGVINKLQGNIKQYDIAFYTMNAYQIELEQNLAIANKNVLDLTEEVKYLRMQINTTNNQINSRQY
jgi:peptidoglycan hydrolase CwlO-like protein